MNMISSVRLCVRNICGKNIRTYFNYKETMKNSESRMLNKMFARAKIRKKPSSRVILKGKLASAEYESSPRQGAALNKVYMEHIVELIQSGKDSAKLLQEGLEITRVRLTKGGDHINIYWICNNEKLSDEDICKLLETASVELQEQIGSLRYVSYTPFVKFIRDLNVERGRFVEAMLKTADFGKDYELTHPESIITPDCNLSDDGFPKMRQDVLGVDHGKIKAKILTEIEIYKVTHTPKENEFAYVEMENLIPFDKKVFEKFYRRKKILDKKLTSRGLYGIPHSKNVELIDEEQDEEDSYANEFWEAIKREEAEEAKEYAQYDEE